MASALFGFVCGLFAWTLLEYIIHAYLGHLPKGKIMVSREHLHHHADIQYFSPLSLKIRGAVPVLSLLLVVTGLLSNWAFAGGFTVAVSVGWTVYEWLHKAIHDLGPTNAYMRWAARHHLHHHFTRPQRNHGVTSPLWDILLGTHEPPARVRVSRKHLAALPWLAASTQSGDGQPAFMADYELI